MQLIALLIEAMVLVLKYHFDPERQKLMQRMQMEAEIEDFGAALYSKNLRLVGKLLELELQRKENRGPPGPIEPKDNQIKE